MMSAESRSTVSPHLALRDFAGLRCPSHFLPPFVPVPVCVRTLMTIPLAVVSIPVGIWCILKAKRFVSVTLDFGI